MNPLKSLFFYPPVHLLKPKLLDPIMLLDYRGKIVVLINDDSSYYYLLSLS